MTSAGVEPGESYIWRGDESAGEMIAITLITNDSSDDEVFLYLLKQVKENIDCVSANGIYDAQVCYNSID